MKKGIRYESIQEPLDEEELTEFAIAEPMIHGITPPPKPPPKPPRRPRPPPPRLEKMIRIRMKITARQQNPDEML